MLKYAKNFTDIFLPISTNQIHNIATDPFSKTNSHCELFESFENLARIVRKFVGRKWRSERSIEKRESRG